MVDTNNYQNSEEEYKLKEEYGAEPLPPKPKESEQPKGLEFRKRIPKIKFPINKKLVIVISIIIALFIIYQFIAPKPSKQLAPSPEDFQTSVTQQLSELTQKFNRNSAKITNIEDELNRIQSLASKTDEVVNNLNTAVSELSKIVQQLTLEQKTVEITKVRKIKPKITYHVRAIVPGRAWLEADDGTTVTVRPGSKLNDYGTVTKIDAREGIIRTDLGFVIKHGINDI
jgi:intracellular multiplication protein IcmG